MGAPPGNANGTTHGLSRSAEYAAWRDMRARCERESHRYFKDYGARGIKVCDRWQEFAAFYADVGPRPGPSYSLDRKDNSRGYEPGNVRWATKLEQGQNTRRNHLVVIDGERMCLAEACRRLGIKRVTVSQRLFKGWSLDDALHTPVV
jgi:hypothetical protein